MAVRKLALLSALPALMRPHWHRGAGLPGRADCVQQLRAQPAIFNKIQQQGRVVVRKPATGALRVHGDLLPAVLMALLTADGIDGSKNAGDIAVA